MTDRKQSSTEPKKKQDKPDPNGYKNPQTDEDKGFIKNPVAGGALPSTQATEGHVNGEKK